jgi:HAD superfamily hydrolase (TIGR01662 family)
MIPQPQAILFDLGSTLLYPRDPWKPILHRACLTLAEDLRASGIPLQPQHFAGAFYQRLRVYYAEREHTLQERGALAVLKETLHAHNWQLEETLQRRALNTLYATTQQNWHPEPDSLPTLEALRARDIRLGILSNASDDEDVQALVAKGNFGAHLDFVLTSAACGYRKPHPVIFERALSHWGFAPQQIAMVGDTLNADILGANQMNMPSVWITRRAAPQSHAIATPTFTIATLQELLGKIA